MKATPPNYPLPLPHHARVGVLGDDPLAGALTDALRSSEKEPHQFMLHKKQGHQHEAFKDLVDVLFVTEPWQQLAHLRDLLELPLRGIVVAACTTALARDADGFFMETVPEGSVVSSLAQAWPHSRVVGAFQQHTAAHLELASLGTFYTDVPIVGDDREATDLVEGIIDDIRGLEAVYAGPTRNAMAVEGFAALIREAESDKGRPLGFRFSGQGHIRILD